MEVKRGEVVEAEIVQSRQMPLLAVRNRLYGRMLCICSFSLSSLLILSDDNQRIRPCRSHICEVECFGCGSKLSGPARRGLEAAVFRKCQR